MDKYIQKLDVQEFNFDDNENFDEIDYDDEDVDEEPENISELKLLQKSLVEFGQLPCYKIVYRACKNFFSFKYGVQFFSYDNTNNEYLKTDIGKVPKRASFYDNAKIVLTILILIGLFIGIIMNYFVILGTEKSQSLTY